MKATIATVLALLAIEAAASGVVRHALHRRPGRKGPLHRRGTAAVNSPLTFHTDWIDQGGYFITLNVGNPPQPFEVLVDTGSSDLYVPGADAGNCEKGNCPGGEFHPDASSTFSADRGAPKFEIGYVDGSEVKGIYGHDTVRVGSAALQGFTFGVADKIQVSPGVVDAQGRPIGPQYGIMGVNFVAGEAALSSGYNYSIPTIPLALKQQGFIGSQSYSLYLDDIEADNGHMIFGGIDTSKFSGDLVTLGVGPGEQLVKGTGFAVNWKGQTTQLTNISPYAANLDSGTAGWQIPHRAFTQILKAWTDLDYDTLQYSNVSGNPLLPCTYINEDASLTVSLAGITNNATVSIDVPLGNMLVPALRYEVTGNYNDTAPLVLNGREQCLFTPYAAPDNSTEFLIGDPFFRSAYTFFNLDEKTVSIAQASYNVNEDESNIVPVGPGNASSTYPEGSGDHQPLPPYTPANNGSSPVPQQTDINGAGTLSAAVWLGFGGIAASLLL